MSNTNNYNPFNVVGRNNIKTYLYNHKTEAIWLIILFIVLLIGLGFFVWTQGRKPKIDELISPDIPPPRYGSGPYGYGLYAPPRAFFERPPALTD